MLKLPLVNWKNFLSAVAGPLRYKDRSLLVWTNHYLSTLIHLEATGILSRTIRKSLITLYQDFAAFLLFVYSTHRRVVVMVIRDGNCFFP